MNHLSEEQLILYYYREGEDRVAVAEHLHSCESCRNGFEALERLLGAVDAWPVPERSEFYGGAVWHRLRPRLDGRRRWSWFLQPRRWAVAAAMSAMLLVGFIAGRVWPVRPVGPAMLAENVRERMLMVDVTEHLDRVQRVLVEMANAPAGSLDITAEQQRAEDLIEDNRLYRQTAATTGQDGVANLLEELERVLLEIAHSPARIPEHDLDQIRGRIERQELLFKVRVVESQVRSRERL